MATNTPVWRGKRAMTEDPTSPVAGVNKDGLTETRIFNGPYDILRTNLPDRLSAVKGSEGLFVDTARVEKMAGGRGKLTIELTSNPFPNPDSDVLELEWVEVQKPLLQHPRYQPSGAKPLDEYDLDIIEEWKDKGGSERHETYLQIVTKYPEALDYVQKFMRGQESFVVYNPVVRITTRSTERPNCGKCGIRSDPPGNAKPSGSYVYLKTADRRTRQDRLWSRVQEWTGADAWDTDIYPSS